MQRLLKCVSVLAGVCGVVGLLLLPSPARAQAITTGTISGMVLDPQGAALPGAAIVAVHVPTGTTYEAVTKADGRFVLLNVRVGGPYSISAKLSGFKDDVVKDVAVALGEERQVTLKLQIASVTDTVQVTASVSPIDSGRAGAGGNISGAVKDALPTISRSIFDIVRVNPLFNAAGGGAGDGATTVSVAGSSFRYNSLQIDGALNNDLFGLAGSAGLPGGGMETQPIAFDAIQELQLVVSPYDVRQGGFTGGGINAVTKSGTNDFHGSAFYFGRNQNLVGKGIDDRAIAAFREKQGGGSLGGRLLRDRAFFFGAGDVYRRKRPTGFSVGQTGVSFGASEALVDQYLSILKNTYGYDPGPNPKAEFSRETDNDKYFGRLDFNLGRGHQLTIRHNYVDALSDIGSPSATAFRTPDAYYRFVDHTRSSVLQLNSAFDNGVNEFRVAYTTVKDHREPQPFEARPFPQVTVTLAPGYTITSGREQFSTANQLDQQILEVTDSYTRLWKNHSFTIGTNNQIFKFRNLFIRDNFGTYNFSNLANFAAGVAQQFDYSFSNTSNPQQAAQFHVQQLGFYLGDTWRVKSNVTLTGGARLDIPHFSDRPGFNETAYNVFGQRTDVVPTSLLWSPRLGINVDLHQDGTEQLRGGAGIFTGRPPYVWLSNQFGNTGLDFTRIGASFNTANAIPFVSSATSQPKTVTGAAAGSFSNEIDFVASGYNYPTVFRANAGWDRKLPWWGLYGSADFIWSRTIQDIKYTNLNYVPSVTVAGVGGRPFFIRRFSPYSDVIMLTNTSQGENWTLSYEVKRPVSHGWYFAAGYAYNHATSIMDGTSDQAASNWGNVYVDTDPNNPALSRSNFDMGHRITSSASYQMNFGRGATAMFSVFYSGQSGRPYTLAFGRDVNGDGRGTNDLLYVPGSATESLFTYTGGTYDDLVAFMNSDSCLKQYIGTTIPRNACRAPWVNTLDGRVAISLPFSKVKTEITLDALNLLNLIHSSWGQVKYVPFNEITVIQPVNTVTATSPFLGYNLSGLTSSTFSKFTRDDLRSRWQLQLGVRFKF